jgi:hypothetical protein
MRLLNRGPAGLVGSEPAHAEMARLFPRVRPGIAVSALAVALPFLVPLSFAYWCYCIFRTHAVLRKLLPDTAKVLEPNRALILTLIANPILPVMSISLVMYGAMAIATVLSQTSGTQSSSFLSVPIALTLGFLASVFAFALAIWCLTSLTKSIVAPFKNNATTRVTNGMTEGTIMSLCMIVPSFLLMWRTELRNLPGLLVCAALQALFFLLAFYELGRLLRPLRTAIVKIRNSWHSDLPSRTEPAKDRSTRDRPKGLVLAALSLVTFAALLGTIYLNFLAMPGSSFAGQAPPLTAEEKVVQENVRKHIKVLSTDIGERNSKCPRGLERAAAYVEASLRSSGLKVEEQLFTSQGQQFKNIVAERKGRKYPDQILVVGAHYDGVQNCPAANDNGSGVAALLEIARMIDKTPGRTVRFVAFANEEPPFFGTTGMGSYQFAKLCRERQDKITAMLSVDSIGYYSDVAGSQQYPTCLPFGNPIKGNFIAFVGNTSSGRLVRTCTAAFRAHTCVPSEGIIAPEFVTGVNWSDQRNFWQRGYPAIDICDTAIYRYSWYHQPEDTAERVVYPDTTRVVIGLRDVVKHLLETD